MSKDLQKRRKQLGDILVPNDLNLKTQLIHFNLLSLTLKTTQDLGRWTPRTSIMKYASFVVSKEKWNWDSNVLCANSCSIPPRLAGTKSKPMAMQLISFLKV
ncbi:hypothetical protein AVEN_116353-1 [Araneus ventricosus]|uniref:Uncharacterized protein n=1 Tax=Araneus ventricosus TaxID=182803 RepID=A0A4Y2KQB3_ARAVE|nr:hypothetical protein AVEN_116353-1 [Araneus ventricosus]